MRLRALFAAVVVAACGSDSTGATTKVVQLVDASVTQASANCGVFAIAPDSIYWHVHLVNTTDVDVPITSIGTTGAIVRATNSALLGRSEFTFASLPFSPKPLTLAARTGDVTVIVSMPTSFAHDCQDLLPPLQRDVASNDSYVTIVVTTPTGQYTSKPVTIQVVSDFSR